MNEVEGLISVIIPVYNVEDYLKKCVDSIINQTYKNLEIILVDDGSTDESSLICDSYLKLDSRIKVIHKKNGGLSDARNTGIDIAKGNYFAFVDSDDYIVNTTLESEINCLKNYNCQIAICNMIRYTVEGNTYSFYNPVDKVTVYKNNDRFKTLNQPSVCNKLFEAALFDNIRFPIGKYYEDTYIYHEVLFRANSVVLTGEDSYMYLIRSNSILGQPKYTIKYFDFIEAVYNRAIFLTDQNIQPYANEACLSLYAAIANAESNIQKNSETNKLFESSRKKYKEAYKILMNSKHKISTKQKLRLFLLRYFPVLHTTIYNK